MKAENIKMVITKLHVVLLSENHPPNDVGVLEKCSAGKSDSQRQTTSQQLSSLANQ